MAYVGRWVHSQKLLTMMPTEEERQKIEEAQLANPDIPLGPAENFLMTLASIRGLAARLQLWAFKLDYDSMEQVPGSWDGTGTGHSIFPEIGRASCRERVSSPV